jgi:sulfatase modifying factor 1
VRQFAEFVLSTGYVSEAERFGWSFCFQGTLSAQVLAATRQQVAAVPWWLPVHGADWLHPNGPDGDALRLGLLQHPVVHVTHNDARAYCRWLRMRLPREAEFEYAARGGQHQQPLPWGANLLRSGAAASARVEAGAERTTRADEHMANLWQGHFLDSNTGEDGYLWSAPVDSMREQNDFALKHIVGNVWEWVADAWTVRHRTTAPDGSVLADPQVELSMNRLDDPQVERVKRGGSYMCHKSYCWRYRTSSRSSNSADSSAQNLGMRCAADMDEQGDVAWLDPL